VNHRHTALILVTAGVTLPGVFLRLAGIHLEPALTAAISGAAIAAAAFLLLWACDAAQTEISQALALAVVALMAVLPEYSIDMYFTWQAGRDASGTYAQYAVANMTGANRLLIGVGWGAIALVYWLRFRKPVRIGEERRTELMFLGAATAYAFVIPLKGTLAWYDGVVFLGSMSGTWSSRGAAAARNPRSKARRNCWPGCREAAGVSRSPRCSCSPAA
jgi:cation:H+ antiporter